MLNTKIRIMLVDDHAMIRRGVKQMLGFKEEFIIVGEAEHGNEVITKVLDLKPDVILMDINLPGKSGIELTTELKKQAPDVKVLALTVGGDQHYLSKMIKAGALGYILKDVDSDTLYEAIKTVARGDAYIPPHLLTIVLSEYREVLVEEKPVVLPGELGLTHRELEIVSYLACGDSNKEIAEKLSISEQTVKNHVSNIFRKMEVEDRTQAVIYAYQKGLISK